MRKHTKLVAIGIATFLVLTIALTATAFAWGPWGDEGQGGASLRETFISKVAGILGLEKEQVIDAFKQARQEMRDEALENRLQKAIQNGFLTEEEATQIREWWQNRPQSLDRLAPGWGFQPGHGWQPQRLPRHGQWHLPLGLIQGDERPSGIITSISRDTGIITLATAEGNEVAFRYTSDTTFILRGVTTIEEGQEAIAWGGEDAEGNLTAKVVLVRLP